MAVLIYLTFVAPPVGATDAAKKVGAEQLMQMVAAAQSVPDADMAQRLQAVVLTDRLSDARLAELLKKAPGEKSRTELVLLADQSLFLAAPADEVPEQPVPDAAATRQMLVKIVNYVNTTVRQLPNLMATRFTNGYEDRPGEDRLTSTGIVSLSPLSLQWVGSMKMQVTYRDRQEVEDKSGKPEKKGAGFGGLTTRGEFGPFLSTVMADALKGTISWARWEKGADGTLAVFHYQVPEKKSD
ncbi:hypothetical protein [Occallatibacter savannae]|uniref:hypothetical protein n=1 Tax=Occallatibacter savannae TaxID=1002691 RepID=UPI000D689C5A|nr:hypothetical protein [Occallatibacter savannae]